MGLLNFPCCRRTNHSASAATPATVVPATLVPDMAASPVKQRRKFSSTATDRTWRPSLAAITEDRAMVVAPTPKKGGGGIKKAKPETRLMASRVSGRTANRDYEHFGVTAFVPTFAPTIFMF